ncbi:MAG: hypothetical protein JW969_08850 [Spirochaetales bacterium]|nr:hypothetical protein [Spirochaetales bacterium]
MQKNRPWTLFLSMVFFFLLAAPCTQAAIVISGGLTHEKETPAGTEYKGVIEIQNKGDKAQEVKIYQTDYEFFADGKVMYGEPGKISRSNANWITFSPKRAVVPPNETVPVYYTITVPDDQTLSGTYWSVIMVEPVPEDSPESSNPTSPDAGNVTYGIKQVFRYGIQMVTNIQGKGDSKLKFLKPQFKKDYGKKILEIDLENIGTLWVKPDVWVELYDETGVFIGKFTAENKRIYPGLSGRFKVEFTDMPEKKYKALIVADCGGDNLFAINVTLLIK